MKNLLAHLVGDYLLQSHYEAVEKTTHNGPALTHAVKYTAAFLPITRNPKALLVIGGTHYLIDRYRLAKYVNWGKNQIAPEKYRSEGVENGGYPNSTPTGLATALLFITDNTMHLLINEWAINKWSNK